MGLILTGHASEHDKYEEPGLHNWVVQLALISTVVLGRIQMTVDAPAKLQPRVVWVHTGWGARHRIFAFNSFVLISGAKI